MDISLSPSLVSVILLSYMIGSISGGVIVGKIKNVDIRKQGSKAAGATNPIRTMGTIFAVSVLYQLSMNVPKAIAVEKATNKIGKLACRIKLDEF